MYYQNGNYMQDLNYYNQNPNMNYNPYINSNYSGQYMNTGFQQQNLSAMYPASYRIILPVVLQVLSNNNMGYLTEEKLNNMVNSVYDVVECDINLGNNVRNTEDSEKSNNNFSRNNSNQNTNSSGNREEKQNPLLRDLIKIIMLNEIMLRRQNNMQQGNMNQNMFV